MNNIRLYLDKNVHKKVATALRLRGYDVISAHEAKIGDSATKNNLNLLQVKKEQFLPSM